LGIFDAIGDFAADIKKPAKASADAGLEMVPRGGIEPPTRGFSIPKNGSR